MASAVPVGKEGVDEVEVDGVDGVAKAMEEVEKAFRLKREEAARGEEERAYLRNACLAIIVG